ncbi:MAG: type II toxin-antitoxin system MqsA family antitoxin [Pseudomonadota bacterium]
MTEKEKKLHSDLNKFDSHIIADSEYDELPELTDSMLEEAKLFRNGAEINIKEYVTQIRAKTNMTQEEFSNIFGFPLSTLRKWEQGKRFPTGAAISLLTIIDHNPKLALEALKIK